MTREQIAERNARIRTFAESGGDVERASQTFNISIPRLYEIARMMGFRFTANRDTANTASIRIAINLRRGGATLEEIARKLQCSPTRVRRLFRLYAQETGDDISWAFGRARRSRAA